MNLSWASRSGRSLRAAEAARVALMLVTGRPPRTAMVIAEALAVRGAAICANGALMARSGPGEMVMSPAEAMGHGGHAGISMESDGARYAQPFSGRGGALAPDPAVVEHRPQRAPLHSTGAIRASRRPFQLFLSLPVVFYSSWIFFDGAVRALRNRTLDMMVLVAVAIGTGWTYSVVVSFTGGGDVFYEAASLARPLYVLAFYVLAACIAATSNTKVVVEVVEGRSPTPHRVKYSDNWFWIVT